MANTDNDDFVPSDGYDTSDDHPPEIEYEAGETTSPLYVARFFHQDEMMY
jgi:hypothetical protein